MAYLANPSLYSETNKQHETTHNDKEMVFIFNKLHHFSYYLVNNWVDYEDGTYIDNFLKESEEVDSTKMKDNVEYM